MSLPTFRSDHLWDCPSMAGPDGPLLNLLERLRPQLTEAAAVAEKASKVVGVTATGAPGVKVTDLPNEILAGLPWYLECVDDWYAVVRTCRRFYHTCNNTKATFPAFFAKDYTKGCLPVHSDLLMAGSARQVADWAVKNRQTRQELWDAIEMESEEGLIKLGVEIARWSVEDVRALHEASIKVIEPLREAIATKRGAIHLQDCGAVRLFDGLVTCDEDGSECGLCIDLRLARTSLYGFVIYCNLFHADIGDSYGQLPLNVGLLGSELRRLWMDCRMYMYEWEGYDVTWFGLDIMGNSRRMLRAYFDAQPGHEDVEKEEITRRFRLFSRIMEHQGLDTLRSLLPDGAIAKDLASSIYSKVWALPLEQVSNERVWDRRNRRTRKQIGWFSMACDEKEHGRQCHDI